ncbi:hypothetical protein Tco_1533662 [Tanacetum coccineum]
MRMVLQRHLNMYRYTVNIQQSTRFNMTCEPSDFSISVKLDVWVAWEVTSQTVTEQEENQSMEKSLMMKTSRSNSLDETYHIRTIVNGECWKKHKRLTIPHHNSRNQLIKAYNSFADELASERFMRGLAISSEMVIKRELCKVQATVLRESEENVTVEEYNPRLPMLKKNERPNSEPW